MPCSALFGPGSVLVDSIRTPALNSQRYALSSQLVEGQIRRNLPISRLFRPSLTVSSDFSPSINTPAMELPDPFLPGAVSLLEQLDKKLMVMLRDGKTLIGYLRTIDQFANLVLHDTLERIHVDQCYGDIPRGIFLIRGENVVLAGEIDESRPITLKKVRE